MRQAFLSQIFIYPVKSLAGIALDSASVTHLGLENDRRWMIVDNQGRFITQRLYPQLALINTAIESDHITLTSPDTGNITLPLKLEEGAELSVKVWRDQVNSLMMSKPQNQWISQYLQTECQFVYMPENTIRSIDPQFAVSSEDRVSFADGFPYLIISQASLDDLNQRLSAKKLPAVSIHRFRPNLFIEGCDAYAEDQWHSFKLGKNLFHVVKPCSRCIMTTVDSSTGKKGKEPLQTLMEYRKQGNQAYFGQNALIDRAYPHSFSLCIGDQLEIITSKQNA